MVLFMIHLTDEQKEQIRECFLEEHISPLIFQDVN